MSVRITIRWVPEDVRDELAPRSALRRQSMQEFLRGELDAPCADRVWALRNNVASYDA